MHWSSKELPKMQTLKETGFLHSMRIQLHSAFHREGPINHILFVSHRWESPTQPDVHGEQLKAIKEYLAKNPMIEWVWYDYSCMPQGQRTIEEQAEFSLMLLAIADLYLSARVLLLVDNSYSSRFWTLFEAWSSMQQLTRTGLRNATDAESRCSIMTLHNASATVGEALVELLKRKSPEEVSEILAKPDIQLTNQKDKDAMIPKLKEMNEHVMQLMFEMDP